MIYVFFLLLAVFSVLFMVSRKRYDKLLATVDRNIYRLKDFMPISLYLLDRAGYKFNTSYDLGLQLRLGELYGHANARHHLRIHWANKLALIMILLIIISLIGASMEEADPWFVFYSLLGLGLAFYLADNEVNEKYRKRRLMMQIDFPDFLNKLILLVNAGMTVMRAMEKIVLDRRHSKAGKSRPLYDELRIMLLEIKAEKPELKAYEDFAKRCRIPEITKFTSVIIQNARKGNAEMVSILRLQASECWEMRKNVARKLGEEASTKLLFPMMIMLAAILMIVVAPSVMQLRGF